MKYRYSLYLCSNCQKYYTKGDCPGCSEKANMSKIYARSFILVRTADEVQVLATDKIVEAVH